MGKLDLDAIDWARLGREFFETYRRPGFGRMPKREVDVLVFHLLERHGRLYDRSDTELAQALGSTPRRLRGLRTDARYLYWQDDQRAERVRTVLFGTIAQGAYETRGDRIAVQVSEPFVRDVVVDVLKANFQLHDTSFNRDLLLVDRVGFGLLVEAFLTDAQREVLALDPEVGPMLRDRTVAEWVSDAVLGEGDALGDELHKNAIGTLAEWIASPVLGALPTVALLLAGG